MTKKFIGGQIINNSEKLLIQEICDDIKMMLFDEAKKRIKLKEELNSIIRALLRKYSTKGSYGKQLITAEQVLNELLDNRETAENLINTDKIAKLMSFV